MKFILFEGRPSEMSGYVDSAGVCDFCHREVQAGFDLTAGRWIGVADEAFGCADCLSRGRFGFEHSTDAGFVTEDGLESFEPEMDVAQNRVFVGLATGPPTEEAAPATPPPTKPDPPAESVELLRRTPGFCTWNEVSWPLHCGDFMVYLGALSQDQLGILASQRGVSRQAFFVEMVGSEYRDFLPSVSTGGDVVLHGFRCRECGEYRGAVDLS